MVFLPNHLYHSHLQLNTQRLWLCWQESKSWLQQSRTWSTSSSTSLTCSISKCFSLLSLSVRLAIPLYHPPQPLVLPSVWIARDPVPLSSCAAVRQVSTVHCTVYCWIIFLLTSIDLLSFADGKNKTSPRSNLKFRFDKMSHSSTAVSLTFESCLVCKH